MGTAVLGRYRIVKRLAHGGMGVVYLARTEGAAGFSKPAVVKRILPDLNEDDKMTQMFVREARIMADLHHPGIVGVLDFGEENGAYIMVLEYVHGFHLGRWYRYVCTARGSFPAYAAIHITIKVLESLHYAHTLKRPDGKLLNIVHRDISPSNILLGLDGQIKVADFGIAHVSGETQVLKTEETTVKGKFPYLAPELFTGQQASVQSDVYACGVVLQELLLGYNEFRGREIAETIHRVFTKQPTVEFPDRKDVPKEVSQALAKALAKSPAQRFASAAEFAQSLRDSRKIADEIAASQLAAEINVDFSGKMAEAIGAEPLTVLDAAWRHEFPEEGNEGSSNAAQASRSGVTPTGSRKRTETSHSRTRTAAPIQPIPAPRSRRRTIGWIAIATVLGAVAVGGGIYALSLGKQSRRDGNAPRIIVIEQERNAEAAETRGESVASMVKSERRTDTMPASGSPDDKLMDPAQDDIRAAELGKKTRGVRTAKSPAADQQRSSLSRAFRAKQAAIKGCFEQHQKSINLQGSPQIAVRFTVEANGSVQSAELVPSPLEKTAFGSCILQVAKQTKFGAQPAPLSFLIPVQVSSTPNPP